MLDTNHSISTISTDQMKMLWNRPGGKFAKFTSVLAAGGIGATINTLSRQSDMSSVYCLLFIIIIIGIIQDIIFKKLEPIIFKHYR